MIAWSSCTLRWRTSCSNPAHDGFPSPQESELQRLSLGVFANELSERADTRTRNRTEGYRDVCTDQLRREA